LKQAIINTVKNGALERNPCGTMSILPVQKARSQSRVCQGVLAETVSMVSRQPFESHYCGPLHLLIAHERLARRRGVTTVEGLPDSELQNLSHTLTFVPAGHRFREWHDPDIPSRATYIHIDPSSAPRAVDKRIAARALAPRVHFQNSALWQTVLKLKTLVEEGETGSSPYGDALAVVLAHELVRLDAPDSAARATLGGLAVWQRRRVAEFIDDHLDETIPVARLAALARLSRCHFCRSFKASFGVSPHKYHSSRRVERAKLLLADPGRSVTDIALEVGFSEASSFTAVFRKLVGHAPTGYRRSLTPGMA
jgi:AraC family transcriptional regulator